MNFIVGTKQIYILHTDTKILCSIVVNLVNMGTFDFCFQVHLWNRVYDKFIVKNTVSRFPSALILLVLINGTFNTTRSENYRRKLLKQIGSRNRARLILVHVKVHGSKMAQPPCWQPRGQQVSHQR